VVEANENRSFGAYAVSSRDARRFVTAWLTEHHFDAFLDRVPLCVSELSANAVLHTAKPFTVGISGSANFVRVAVTDSVPDRVPIAVPQTGVATDITALSETGRGLVVVGELANRWGIWLGLAVKRVWCEFDLVGRSGVSSDPEIVDMRPEVVPANGFHRVRFLGLPVRAAIASGLDVENAVRDLELTPQLADSVVSDEARRLLVLIERSTSSRLAGRHAAMHAAGNDQVRFDFTLDATDDELAATGELTSVLAQRAPVSAPGPADQVKAFRTWVTEEALRQLAGQQPTVCPLPS